MSNGDENIVDSVPPEGHGGSQAPPEQPSWQQPGPHYVDPNAPQWAPPAYSPGVNAEPPRRKRSGLWFGLLLILFGIALIVERLIPGLTLWSLWPLIIVAAGFIGMFRHDSDGRWRVNRVTDGLVTVVIGFILFANTTGALPWSVWLSVFTLWPLLLVAAGIDIIGKSMDNVWLRVFSNLVVLGGLLFGALVMPAGTFSLGLGIGSIGREPEPFEFSEPASRRIEEGRARIGGAVGALTITEGSDLIAASGRSPFGEPDFDVTKDGERAEAEVTFGERGFFAGTTGDPRMDVELSGDVAWELDIETGVSSLDADLSDVDVRGLTVSAGVSDCDITLGELADDAGDVEVSVQAGVSTVTIKVPRDSQLVVSAEGGLSTVGLPDGSDTAIFGDTDWRSDGFDEDEPAYRIEFSSGIADVNVEYY